ncbi:maleylacetate reductase [Parasphingopyxis algicola]|uniref:maleylacetate reductase n=1 Tax=Parasphingopyxis algicola TaxID=2026624 RepID=UPI0015A0AD0F|nr:maleylacetate reductase [Parasphingopyxis algicola]QLC26424.1 maleylacetate reductase [Parasphingopyxis algicola]
MSRSFVYTARPARVVFGRGTIDRLVEEADMLGIERALVLTTDFQAPEGGRLVERLGRRAAGLFTGAVMHTPVAVTETAMKIFEERDADGIVSFGGGSTTGLGKAIALRNDAPQLVIPTSYAGSEMTAIVGQTEDGKKTTLTSPKVLPETVIYDVDFTLSLLPLMTVTSGMNAIAHAVEALYAENANPVLSLMAEEGIRAMVSALPRLAEGSGETDIEARSDALYGAWLCGTCLGLGGVALHHKLCHVLGGSFDLPHAETHTIILPHALTYNAPAIPDAMQRLRRAMDCERPAARLFDIAKQGGAPVALKDLGMPETGIERVADITLDNPYYNPRPLDRQAIVALLRNAWEGGRPEC